MVVILSVKGGHQMKKLIGILLATYIFLGINQYASAHGNDIQLKEDENIAHHEDESYDLRDYMSIGFGVITLGIAVFITKELLKN